MKRIRKIYKKDLKEVYEIHKVSWNNPMNFVEFSKQVNCNKGLLIKENEEIAGYIVFTDQYVDADLKTIAILDFAVFEKYRRIGLGSELLEKVLESSVELVSVLVEDKNLPAQLFLKQNNFIGKTVKDSDDLYQFYLLTHNFYERYQYCIPE
jgi:ribosomal protein S18 acetylase RimI-like enzyme